MPTAKWRRENTTKLRKYRKIWYYKNREHALSKIKERKALVRIWVKALKEKLECSKCHENHPACLEFHHIDSDNKEINLSQVASNGWSLAKIQLEITKCEVLCSNCHKKLHYENHRGVV